MITTENKYFPYSLNKLYLVKKIHKIKEGKVYSLEVTLNDKKINLQYIAYVDQIYLSSYKQILDILLGRDFFMFICENIEADFTESKDDKIIEKSIRNSISNLLVLKEVLIRYINENNTYQVYLDSSISYLNIRNIIKFIDHPTMRYKLMDIVDWDILEDKHPEYFIL